MSALVQEERGYAGHFCNDLMEEGEQEDNENKTERELGDGPNIAIIKGFIIIHKRIVRTRLRESLAMVQT